MTAKNFKLYLCFLDHKKIELAALEQANKAFMLCSVPTDSILEYTNTSRERIVELTEAEIFVEMLRRARKFDNAKITFSLTEAKGDCIGIDLEFNVGEDKWLKRSAYFPVNERPSNWRFNHEEMDEYQAIVHANPFQIGKELDALGTGGKFLKIRVVRPGEIELETYRSPRVTLTTTIGGRSWIEIENINLASSISDLNVMRAMSPGLLRSGEAMEIRLRGDKNPMFIKIGYEGFQIVIAVSSVDHFKKSDGFECDPKEDNEFLLLYGRDIPHQTLLDQQKREKGTAFKLTKNFYIVFCKEY
ncbi:Oidioi.mRNA.OKI2018_I69.chr1.g365.t1.cds [Oikopleura dioica]|uniref:Oidioi.mRNA.OKI2018_I69.chr1.g365.t1.cds n=1 Tax=Oikopleura dioica TaxID=34765 RepID=A0ABN7SLA3_OIKDI|nr:Oidioi.mRNA.OKI2018_I69.chr1.g365.t1.cds [Oikopleura dioica]